MRIDGVHTGRRPLDFDQGMVPMRRHALLAAAMLLAACDAPTSPRGEIAAPSAQVVRNSRSERLSLAINDCTGELIAFDATFHVVAAVTFDAAGGYHVKFHRNISGTAVNTVTGTEYVIMEEDNNEYTVGQGADEQTSVSHFNLISKGSAPNEVAQVMFHFTIAPDGTLTTYHDNVRFDCSQYGQ
jgi:hypothetical protein